MDSLISTFHLDIKLLIAQIINFGIVFSILYFFALKPLLAAMQERSGKIDKSLKDAKEIEHKLSQAEAEYHEVIKKAKQDGAALMEKTASEAAAKREELLAKAKEEIGQIINIEKEKMRADKAEAIKEIKAEIAELVTASLEKILDKKVTAKEDHELIKKITKATK